MSRKLSLVIQPDRADAVDELWHVTRYRDFTGGENRNLLPEFLKPNQLLIAFNMTMTGEGVLETRRGKSAMFVDILGSGGVTSGHRFVKENGDSYLVVQIGTALYHGTYDGSALTVALTSLATGLNAAKFRSEVWKDQLFLTNGVDNVKTYNGTALTDVAGTPPKSKYIKVYGSRLWLVDVANPNQLRFSGLEDPTTWDVLNVIKLRDGDGDVITGISPQDGGMIITKNRSVWPLYGTNINNFRIPETPLSAAAGCVAPDTLLDQGLFLGLNNLYTFSLTSVEEISDTHRVVIENMTLADKQAAFAVYQPLEKRALVHLGSGILNIEERYRGITSWDALNAKSFAVLDAKDDDGSILVGDATEGMLYKLNNSESDAGISIPSILQHAYLDEGLVDKKWWRYYAPEIESLGTMNYAVTYAFDVDYSRVEGLKQVDLPADNSLVWGEGKWGEKDWGSILRITDPFYFHNARGNRISFKFTALDRIKYLGYVTKWCKAGNL